jgi:hypothetical protein
MEEDVSSNWVSQIKGIGKSSEMSSSLHAASRQHWLQVAAPYPFELRHSPHKVKKKS